MFVLDDNIYVAADSPPILARNVIGNNLNIVDFIKRLKKRFTEPIQRRILHADLDLICDPDPVQQEKNLDAFVERVTQMKVNTVYLQAFCDEEGSGNISEVYFPNRVLPMRADLFNRVVNQLFIRGIEVYAWMPMLSIVLPDQKENDELRVRELKDGKIILSTAGYKRLSPFNPQAREKLIMLYEDMAASARISGVVFNDDGYLDELEDFSPSAYQEYRKIDKDGKGYEGIKRSAKMAVGKTEDQDPD